MDIERLIDLNDFVIDCQWIKRNERCTKYFYGLAGVSCLKCVLHLIKTKTMRNETVQIDLARYEQFQRRGVAEFQMLFYSFTSNINLFTRNVGEVDLTG